MRFSLLACVGGSALLFAGNLGCDAGVNVQFGGAGGASATGTTSTTMDTSGSFSTTATGTTGTFGTGSSMQCMNTCSTDLHSVLDCHGNFIAQCSGGEGCDSSTGTCADACGNAIKNKLSVGCEYYS